MTGNVQLALASEIKVAHAMEVEDTLVAVLIPLMIVRAVSVMLSERSLPQRDVCDRAWHEDGIVRIVDRPQLRVEKRAPDHWSKLAVGQAKLARSVDVRAHAQNIAVLMATSLLSISYQTQTSLPTQCNCNVRMALESRRWPTSHTTARELCIDAVPDIRTNVTKKLLVL